MNAYSGWILPGVFEYDVFSPKNFQVRVQRFVADELHSTLVIKRSFLLWNLRMILIFGVFGQPQILRDRCYVVQ